MLDASCNYSRILQLALPAMIATAAALFGPAGARAASLDPPPDAIELSFKLAGEGVQRYVCTPKAGSAGVFEWVLKEPVAKLFDSAHQEVGTHSAGPTWTARDGSKVAKKRLVATADAPTPDAIAWLLLEVEPAGHGMLANVRYVKRIDTTGGKAPAPEGACGANHVGATRDVPYTATYVFFVAKPAPAAPK
jgi:hypothetical protein